MNGLPVESVYASSRITRTTARKWANIALSLLLAILTKVFIRFLLEVKAFVRDTSTGIASDFWYNRKLAGAFMAPASLLFC